jgi:flagellar assembly factor FliW
MGQYVQGHYKPTNPSKYVGTYPIVYRSSWEFKLMEMFDAHSSITEWASEALKIPYTNPFTNKYTVYVPDFVISYIDASGARKTEIIEVKPYKETFMEEAKTQKNKLAVVLNAHKWAAAQAFAVRNGMTFRVMNEQHIFNNPGKGKK